MPFLRSGRVWRYSTGPLKAARSAILDFGGLGCLNGLFAPRAAFNRLWRFFLPRLRPPCQKIAGLSVNQGYRVVRQHDFKLPETSPKTTLGATDEHDPAP